MGSKRKDKHREKRSRSRTKVKKERHRSRSESSHRQRKKRRERSRSSSSSSSDESFASLKNLAKQTSTVQHSNQIDNKPIEEYNQEYFFRMSKRIQEDFREEFDKGN